MDCERISHVDGYEVGAVNHGFISDETPNLHMRIMILDRLNPIVKCSNGLQTVWTHVTR